MHQLSFLAPEPALPVRAIKPRPYQLDAIMETVEAFSRGERGVILRIPTGGGKTLTGAMIADWWIQSAENNRVLVLSHERQLVWQFAQELDDYFGESPAIEMGDRHAGAADMQFNKIVVASRATLLHRNKGGEMRSRLAKFDPTKYNWLVLIDEVHRYSYGLKSCGHIFEWFEKNPASRRLGITATPERSDKVSLSRICPHIGIDYKLYDIDGGPCAVRDGWAVPYDQRYICVQGVDFTALKEVAGDFDDHELESILNTQAQLAALCEPMMEMVGERRTLIFSPTRKMAHDVAAYINAKLGDNAAFSLDGEVPDEERLDTYRRHQNGVFQFLSVCGLCREGYNDPGIQAVAVFRPTKSRSLAEQMKGRGCRPLRGLVDQYATPEERRAAIALSEKPNCMIVDLVGVTGVGDCASTAHLMAVGKPDDVIARANANMAAQPGKGWDVAAEIHKAEAELKKEAEERAAALRRAQEERQRREEERARARREIAEHRARLGASVSYNTFRVDQGNISGGATYNSFGQEMATYKQKRWLAANNVAFDEKVLTKKKASDMIYSEMKKQQWRDSKKPNQPQQPPKPSAPPKPIAATHHPHQPQKQVRIEDIDFDEAFSVLRDRE